MCGIVGALTFNNNFQITNDYIIRMRDTMIHRGPDGAGLWISKDKRVGFGHRRLSIIDLSNAANQPMCNENETIWVCFNGEIYNHADIKNELIKTGNHKWKTDHSDTEVIIHAYEEWGIDCIHKFRGMFAIAVWDDRKKELFLVRDRIGIKPIYYSIFNNRIIFASEIKAILQDKDQKRSVNEESFYHFLSFLTSPAPDTLFEGIKKLPAGCWLKISLDGRIQENKWWDVWDYTKPLSDLSEDEISYKIINELRISVQLRKISDVPVGIFLSGGIDSTTNAVLFSEKEADRVKTFTIGYKGSYESYQNEFVYAEKAAKLVNAEYFEKSLTQDQLLDFLPDMIRFQDEPIADPVCVPIYFVSKLARDNNVTVCQIGEGADELFCGYPSWMRKLKLAKYNDWAIPNSIKKIGLLGLKLLGFENNPYYEMLRRGASNVPIFWGGSEAFPEVEKKSLLSERLQKKFKSYSSWEAIKPIYERFKTKAWDKSHLNWMSYLDLNLRLPELLLMRVDKMSMAVSLEAREPFLDHKLVELAMSIPEKIKIKNNTLKYILKKSVTGIIPDEIINRKKQGFGVPVYEWFLDRLGDTAREKLIEFCNKTDFINYKYIQRLFEQKRGSHIWFLLNFVLWWEEYIK